MRRYRFVLVPAALALPLWLALSPGVFAGSGDNLAVGFGSCSAGVGVGVSPVPGDDCAQAIADRLNGVGDTPPVQKLKIVDVQAAGDATVIYTLGKGREVCVILCAPQA